MSLLQLGSDAHGSEWNTSIPFPSRQTNLSHLQQTRSLYLKWYFSSLDKLSLPDLMIYSLSKPCQYSHNLRYSSPFQYYLPTELLAGVTEGGWDEPMALGEALSKSRMDSFWKKIISWETKLNSTYRWYIPIWLCGYWLIKARSNQCKHTLTALFF